MWWFFEINSLLHVSPYTAHDHWFMSLPLFVAAAESKHCAHMTPSCWFFRSWWCLPLMLAVVAAEVQWEGCSGSGGICGNLTISYPFWLVDTDTGRSCGSDSADFEVACYNNTPLLRGYELSGFQIVNITYEERSLRALDLGMLNLLKLSNSCNIIPSWNTSAKLAHPFRISNTNLNLILYNCTEAVGDRGLVETKMGCGNQHKVFVGVEELYDETRAIKGCDACVVPVREREPGVERSPIYPPKFISKFSLQPFSLIWFNLHPQILKTVQNYTFLQPYRF
jgi:hypothetical protein